MLEILGRQRKSIAMGYFTADKDAANLKGHMHPLVEIQGDRISSFNTGEQRFYIICEYCNEIVDGTGVDGSGTGDDADRQVSIGSVFLDTGFQCFQVDCIVSVDRNLPKILGSKTQDLNCLLVAAVNFRGSINCHSLCTILQSIFPHIESSQGIAGNGQPDKICH